MDTEFEKKTKNEKKSKIKKELIWKMTFKQQKERISFKFSRNGEV